MTSSDVPETIPEHLIPYYLQLELAAELLTDAPEELKKRYTILVENSLSELNKAKNLAKLSEAERNRQLNLRFNKS